MRRFLGSAVVAGLAMFPFEAPAGRVHAVTPGAPVEISRHIFGVNNNLADGRNLPERMGFAAALESVGAVAIRYPGGSPASFWDATSGRYIPLREIRAVWPNPWFQWEIPKVAGLPEGALTAETVGRFAASRGVTVQWTLNLTTRHEHQAAMIEALAAADVSLKLVEMDNETYFWGARFWGEEGVRRYGARVKVLAEAIRRLAPGARIGAVGDDHEFWGDPAEKVDPHRTVWNRVLAEEHLRGAFDGWVLHHYLAGWPLMGLDDTTLPSAFLAWPQVSMLRAERELGLERTGRAIWITEYNVNFHALKGAENGVKRWIASTQDTGWSALYAAGFLVTALSRPRSFPVLNYHSLMGGGGFAMMEASDLDSLCPLQVNPVAQVFSMLASAAKDAERARPVVIAGNPPLGVGLAGEPDPGAIQGVLLEGSGGRRLFLINRGGKAVALGLDGVGEAQREAMAYEAPGGSPRWVPIRPCEGETPEENGPLKPARIGVTGGAIVLPPYALASVELTG